VGVIDHEHDIATLQGDLMEEVAQRLGHCPECLSVRREPKRLAQLREQFLQRRRGFAERDRGILLRLEMFQVGAEDGCFPKTFRSNQEHKSSSAVDAVGDGLYSMVLTPT
jgi:hypothetical protein